MFRTLFRKLTYANVMATAAVIIALGGTATAAVVITSNSQVASNTISGHKPPSGKHSNLISGSVNGQDLAANSVNGTKVADHSIKNADVSLTIEHRVIGGGPAQPAFQNGWVVANPAFETPAFGKDASGVVHLEGFVHNDTATISTIFTLPPGYRPSETVEEPVKITSNGPIGYVTIANDGTVQSSIGTNDVHLDGVTFPAN
jgi:hypothetical protein